MSVSSGSRWRKDGGLIALGGGRLRGHEVVAVVGIRGEAVGGGFEGYLAGAGYHGLLGHLVGEVAMCRAGALGRSLSPG